MTPTPRQFAALRLRTVRMAHFSRPSDGYRAAWKSPTRNAFLHPPVDLVEALRRQANRARVGLEKPVPRRLHRLRAFPSNIIVPPDGGDGIAQSVQDRKGEERHGCKNLRCPWAGLFSRSFSQSTGWMETAAERGSTGAPLDD